MDTDTTTHFSVPDFDGTRIFVDAAVRKVHIDDGAPAWATTGVVVGFTRTNRAKVHWDGVSYGPERWQFPRAHSVDPGNLRVVTR